MKKLGILLLSSTLLLAGCSQQVDTKSNGSIASNKEDVTTIKFKNMLKEDTLKSLHNQEVRLVGFMATNSPLDGSMAYLMNLPYQNCTFCAPNTNTAINTMAIFPKKNATLPFEEVPVEVTGTLKYEPYMDEMGYSYNYRMVNVTVKPADVQELNLDAQSFTKVVNSGFVPKYSQLLTMMQIMTNWGIENVEPQSLEPIDLALVEELRSYLVGVEDTTIQPLVNLLTDVEMTTKTLNELLTTEQYRELLEYSNEVTKFAQSFNTWLLSVELN